jgi:hypothetical protein
MRVSPGEYADRNRFGALTWCNPGRQWNIHQCKNGINKTLRSPQGQPEHAFNDQNGGDGEIRIALRSAPEEGVADSYQA